MCARFNGVVRAITVLPRGIAYLDFERVLSCLLAGPCGAFGLPVSWSWTGLGWAVPGC